MTSDIEQSYAKKLLRPSSLLFYLLTILLFFGLGMIYASLTGAAEGQGLAGGAIVLGYGVLWAGIAFVGSIFAVAYLNTKLITRLNLIFAIAIVSLWAVLHLRYRRNIVQEKEIHVVPGKVASRPLVATGPAADLPNKTAMGLGMMKPNFHENRVLRFYGGSNPGKQNFKPVPTDSLVFARTESGVEITYAPPWFVPAHMKLDYDILFIRLISIRDNFLEVVVNEADGQTAYVNRDAGTILYWPEFLLSIHSIEPLAPQDNLVRVKPMSHASPITTEFAFLKPVQIVQEWAKVELFDDGFNSLGTGWIRWQQEGRLLISYSLLS